jgi:hypothetical protein
MIAEFGFVITEEQTFHMHKLIPVEEARELMNEAKNWGLWRWLMEKGRVRATADRATDALYEAEKEIKSTWNDDLKRAYLELEAKAAFEKNSRSRQHYEKAMVEAKHIDPEIKLAVQRVKEADDEAYDARMDAEDTFDEAERILSTSMACDGAQKAIDSWDLRLKALRKAEALARGK